MIPHRLLTPLLLLFLVESVHAGDWPWWRGPDRNGEADATVLPPLELTNANMIWSVPLEGRSHGSPIVSGERVILAIADEKSATQSLACFARTSGEKLWETVLHTDGMEQKSNKKASWASGTPASDGTHVFINFVSGTAAWTSAVEIESGRKAWMKKICDYRIHQGYGSSPAIFENLVIVSADNKLGGAVVAFERDSGDEVWRVERAAMPNYPSPVILDAAGKTQLFLTGTERVTSLEPGTGELLWELEGATTECVTSTVTDGTHIYSSGGYPKNHVAAIAADGSREVVWETNDRVYVPSMLIREDFLYAVMDSGVGICWNAGSGKEVWKARIGGTFSASPILVGDRIYAVNESGDLTVFLATPDKLEVLSRSKVGDEVFATPAICDGRVYLRVAFYEGNRRSERLVVYGEEAGAAEKDR